MMERKESGGKRVFTRLTDNLISSQIMAAGLAVFLLVAAIFAAYTGAQSKVILQAEGKKLQVATFTADVGALLQEQGIVLGKQDQVTPRLDTRLRDGMTVEVRRAIHVAMQVGGQDRSVTTTAGTVGDLLKENKVRLSKLDIVSPVPETKLAPDMRVKVDLVTLNAVEEEVPVAFNVRRENDGNMARGITQVLQEGVKGLERRSWEITYKNGREIGRRLVASTVIRKPMDKIIKVGALQLASRGGTEIRFSKAYNMVATAYTHTGHNTATGIKPQVGIVAVDPSVIPLGTRLYVEGYGYCRAMDVGGGIKGNHIDLFLETGAAARQWGVRQVTVYVLE
ncbi:MAG: ubiquitin-like domain-containing protein [Firmicutes bacterium]|nr:ubiquitin-like domain-containing protein [Bacillota bacterium]